MYEGYTGSDRWYGQFATVLMSHAYVDSSKASADYGIMPASICYYVLAMGTIMCINREERDVVNEKEFFPMLLI